MVEFETGRLLYCGPDLLPEEEDQSAGKTMAQALAEGQAQVNTLNSAPSANTTPSPFDPDQTNPNA